MTESRPWSRLLKPILLALGGVAIFIVIREANTLFKREPTVEVEKVTRQNRERILALTGRVRAKYRVDVTPVTRGRLIRLSVQEGDRVVAGQLIGELDSQTLEADIAEAEVRKSEAADRLLQAQRDLARNLELAESGFVSDTELEQAKLQSQIQERALKAAEKRGESLMARREDLRLRSPLDGIVLERPIDPGQTVSPGDLICRLANDIDPWIEAEVDERFVTALEVGQPALASPIGETESPLNATLVTIGQSVDRVSGTVLVRFELAKSSRTYPVGLTFDVNVVIESHQAAIVIPRSAIRGFDAQPWVLVAEKSSEAPLMKARRREIEVIDWPGSELIVRRGLKEDELLVLDPTGVETLPGFRLLEAPSQSP